MTAFLVRHRERLVPGLLVVCVATVYANVFGNGWHYDDLHSITENPHLRSLDHPLRFLTDPAQFSRDPDKAMYRPLLLLTFALNYSWSQLETYSYHLVNVALHAGCAVLVWWFLRGLGARPGAALFGALVFALHPLGTEPVNYISSRSELLMALWVLGAVVAHQRAGGAGAGAAARAVSLACFALGLLSKSVAIVTPVLLVLHDATRPGGRRRLRLAVHAPYVILALLYLLLVREHLGRAVVSEPLRSVGVQLATQAKAVSYYARLLVFPVGLNVHHQFFEAGLFIVIAASGGFAVSLLPVACRDRRILLGVGWMAATLAPTVLVPLNVLVNDHRLYLPLVGGVVALTGWMGGVLRPGLRRRLGILALVCLGVLTWQRNRVWLDEYTLWSDAAAKSPHPLVPVAYIHLGNYAKEHGALDEAIGYYERALEIAPDHVAARNNLATVYQRQGDLDRAIAAFRDLLQTDPDVDEAWHNLGRALQEQAARLRAEGDENVARDRLAQARSAYSRVSADGYHYPLALNNIGTVFEAQGRPDSAAHYYRRALAVAGDTEDARRNLDRLLRELEVRAPRLLELGQLGVLEGLCTELLQVRPEHRAALFFLAISRFQQGRYADSLEPNRRLVAAHPDFEWGYLQLANLYETLGDVAAAAEVYRRHLRRYPNGELAEEARSRLHRLRGQGAGR